MSDYLERLTNRLFGLERDLLPRGRSRYEPDPSGSVFEPRIEEREELEVAESLRPDAQTRPTGEEQPPLLPSLEIRFEPPALPAEDEKETQPALSKPAVALRFPDEHLLAPDIASESPLPLPEPSPRTPSWQEPVPGPTYSPHTAIAPDLPTPRVKQPVPRPESFPHAARTRQPSPIAEPASSASGENEAHPVQITIGRVEVRLSHQPTPPPNRSAARRNEPKVSLDDYLKRRSGGQA